MPKMNVNLTITKDYRKNDCLAAKKQTQFKPNFFKGQNELRAYPKIRPHPRLHSQAIV